MPRKILITAAAAMFLAGGAMAQTIATPTPQMDTKADADAKAATGVASDASSVVAMADLKVGARVYDKIGAEVGQIANVTPGANGEPTMVTLKQGDLSLETSANALWVRGDQIYLNRMKQDVWSDLKQGK